VLRDLTSHLLEAVPNAEAGELEGLAEWAIVALGSPGAFYSGDFEHVGDAGFQYLRALFGGPVVVPGEHVSVFAHEVTGDSAGLMPEEDVGLACAQAGLSPDAVESALWDDYAAGQDWGADAAPEAAKWVGILTALCQIVQEGGELPALWADMPTRTAARGYREAALLTLAALDDRACGRAFDAEDQFALAHRAAVLQIRRFRAAPRPAAPALLQALDALAQCTGEQIFARDRLIPRCVEA